MRGLLLLLSVSLTQLPFQTNFCELGQPGPREQEQKSLQLGARGLGDSHLSSLGLRPFPLQTRPNPAPPTSPEP